MALLHCSHYFSNCQQPTSKLTCCCLYSRSSLLDSNIIILLPFTDQMNFSIAAATKSSKATLMSYSMSMSVSVSVSVPTLKPTFPDDGGDFCTYTQNLSCWPTTLGRPPCCLLDQIECPDSIEDVPCEDDRDGRDFCTEEPDLSCWPFTFGRPLCCWLSRDGCPASRPRCDVILGGICTTTPNTDCWPTTGGASSLLCRSSVLSRLYRRHSL